MTLAVKRDAKDRKEVKDVVLGEPEWRRASNVALTSKMGQTLIQILAVSGRVTHEDGMTDRR